MNLYNNPLTIAYAALIVSIGVVGGLSIGIARVRRKDWRTAIIGPVMAALFVCVALLAPVAMVGSVRKFAAFFGVDL